MPRGAPKLDDETFIRLITELGPAKMAQKLGVPVRGLYYRRASLEDRYKQQITVPEHYKSTRHNIAHPHRAVFDIKDGVILVGSDCHYWPGDPSVAHRAFVKFCKDMKPKCVILNGDVIDACRISRHPPIGWENLPSVQEEIEVAQDRLHEIEMAAGRGVEKIWTLGNHDSRFETRLATVAPEFALLHGFHLKDHFPHWKACWSVFINDAAQQGGMVVKHRFKSGIHAPHNNTIWAGRSIVTGHLHSAKVYPISNYNTGIQYGVDTGCIADTMHKAFIDYTEDNPRSWRSGFGVFTFVGGQLLQPELVLVWDDKRVQFRGELIKV